MLLRLLLNRCRCDKYMGLVLAVKIRPKLQKLIVASGSLSVTRKKLISELRMPDKPLS